MSISYQLCKSGRSGWILIVSSIHNHSALNASMEALVEYQVKCQLHNVKQTSHMWSLPRLLHQCHLSPFLFGRVPSLLSQHRIQPIANNKQRGLGRKVGYSSFSHLEIHVLWPWKSIFWARLNFDHEPQVVFPLRRRENGLYWKWIESFLEV